MNSVFVKQDGSLHRENGTADIIPFPTRRPFLATPGGNDYDPPMEARISVIEQRLNNVESQLSDIKTDIRSTRSWIIAAVGISATIIIGFAQYQLSMFQNVMNRNWEVSRKAEDRASEANIKVEAMRLATEWQKHAAPHSAPPSR